MRERDRAKTSEEMCTSVMLPRRSTADVVAVDVDNEAGEANACLCARVVVAHSEMIL